MGVAMMKLTMTMVDDSEDDGLQLDNVEKRAIASSKVRPYLIPKINFDASEYPDLIDWEATQLSEPPLTLLLTNEQLNAFKNSPTGCFPATDV